MKEILGTPGRAGDVTVIWLVYRSRPCVMRIFLSVPQVPARRRASESYPAAPHASCPEIDRLAEDLAGFLAGEAITFGLDLVRMDLCSPFQQKVLRAEHGIPRGRVSTYGRIARHLGSARGARAVGNCLARNPFPIVIPCHRAIRSDGTLGGYQGGAEMKRALLQMEGIVFDHRGRAAVSDLYY